MNNEVATGRRMKIRGGFTRDGATSRRRERFRRRGRSTTEAAEESTTERSLLQLIGAIDHDVVAGLHAGIDGGVISFDQADGDRAQVRGGGAA